MKDDGNHWRSGVMRLRIWNTSLCDSDQFSLLLNAIRQQSLARDGQNRYVWLIWLPFVRTAATKAIDHACAQARSRSGGINKKTFHQRADWHAGWLRQRRHQSKAWVSSWMEVGGQRYFVRKWHRCSRPIPGHSGDRDQADSGQACVSVSRRTEQRQVVVVEANQSATHRRSLPAGAQQSHHAADLDGRW